MRSRLILLTLSFGLALATLSCTKKTSDSPNSASSANSADNTSGASSANTATDANNTQKQEAPKPPLVVPSGTSITVSLGSSLGSKLSESGQKFTGTTAKDVVEENVVAIPKGTSISGTVVDAKPLGKFAGGAVLEIRLDSINVNGADVPVHASARSFSIKGKGKRTGIMAGGGAALGGIIGGIAGGGKGAAIGLVAGGGAGGAGAAFTGNKEIVLPAESVVTFQLRQAIEVQQ
jgi:hypothetical protein